MTPVIIGESVRGESHIRHDIECQDSYLIIDGVHKHDRKGQFYTELSQDIKIVAVADGHGSSSCPYSKTGSQTAVNVFCDLTAEYAAKFKNDMDSLFVALNREGETTRISRWIVGEWEKRILQHHKMEQRNVPLKESGDADADAIWKLYGTTLLGMLITKDFIFAFQLGDGDLTFVDEKGVTPVIDGDKILGVETHSISKKGSWKKVHTRVVNLGSITEYPNMFILSTDGWINSHSSIEEFNKTCKAYFETIKEMGPEAVEKNLKSWLSETSSMGCGDDITTVLVYFKEE